MRRKWIILCVLLLIAAGFLFLYVEKMYTIQLIDKGNLARCETICPLTNMIKVSGDCDTDVVFTDIETGKEYTIGYITTGVSEKIKLQKGKWYHVSGRGNLWIYPVKMK